MSWTHLGVIGWWLAAACVLYAYAGYPLVVAVLARLRARAVRSSTSRLPSATIVIAAHDEEANVARRVRELARQLRASGASGEILVVSDGSTDRTAETARALGDPLVRVLELPEQRGKAWALNRAADLATTDVLVFADARQTWDDEALRHLLANFADEDVGAVSGELFLEARPGVMAGFGFYWRLEKWLRKRESRVHSAVGVTGAVCAVRRELFPRIPPGTILDDVYWPLCVALQNKRVIFESRARAFDRLPDRTRDEFRRKIRTLSGNFQLVQRLPASLLPWRNPIWFQFTSHKMLRLAAPWALLVLLILSPLLPGLLYRLVFGCQIVCYLLALRGIASREKPGSRLAAAAGSFAILNAASWCSFWVWITGRAGRTWRKVSYDGQPVGAS